MIPPFRRDFDAARDVSAARYALQISDVAAWTPTLTFATPGDLSVAYSARIGKHWRIGNIIGVHFVIVTSSFTHTTAAGALQISGLPFLGNAATNWVGACSWGGITKANYTQVTPRIQGAVTTISFLASGSGVAASAVTTADVPTGGAVNLQGQITYPM